VDVVCGFVQSSTDSGYVVFAGQTWPCQTPNPYPSRRTIGVSVACLARFGLLWLDLGLFWPVLLRFRAF